MEGITSAQKYITNLWSKVGHAEDVDSSTNPAHHFSLVVLDFYEGACEPIIEPLDALRYSCRFRGCQLNMPSGAIHPRDGLLKNVSFHEVDCQTVQLTVTLEHPTDLTWEIKEGCPSQVNLQFDRSLIRQIFSGTSIALDPAHGGHDTGGRSPTDLEEKWVVLDLGKRLKELLLLYGANAILSRDSDQFVHKADRAHIIDQFNPHMVVSLHTGADPRGNVIGPRTGHARHSNQVKSLAVTMQNALASKLIFPDGGTFTTLDWLMVQNPDISLMVEIANITSRLEEGWMRDDGFRQIMAEALFNGIKNALYKQFS